MAIVDVRVYLAHDHYGLEGVKVRLLDADRRSVDDLLGEGRTAPDGRARISYSDASNRDEVLEGPSPSERAPDLYLQLLGRDGAVVHSTRRQVQRNRRRQLISVPLSLEQARAWGFVVPKRPADPKRALRRRLEAWSKHLDADPGPGATFDVCVTRTALEVAAGLMTPSTDLQRSVRAELGARSSDEQLAKLTAGAERAKAAVDELLATRRRTCPAGGDVERLAQLFLHPQGRGRPILEALRSRDPDPEAGLGSPRAGRGLFVPFTWNKTCLERFRRDDLPDVGREAMEHYWPEAPKVLLPPTVNLLEAWEPNKTVRSAALHDRELTVDEVGYDFAGSPATIEMNVALDDPGCLVLLDDGTGRQAMVTDVRPGQKLRLLGSGFVAASATIEAQHWRWRPGVDDGRLVPESNARPATGLDDLRVDVYGSTDEPPLGQDPKTWNLDQLVIRCPEAMEEGLYGVRLRFRNDSEYFTAVEQDPTLCTLTTTREAVLTQTLFLAVLPEPKPRPVRMAVPEVFCDDETDPERILLVNLFDDIHCHAQSSLLTFFEAPDGTIQAGYEDRPPVEADVRIKDAPYAWQTGLQTYPAIGWAMLEPHQSLSTTVRLFEVEGDADRALLALVLLVAAIIIAVLVVALVLVLLPMLGVALETGLALLPLILSALFPAMTSVAGMIVAATTGAEAVLEAATMYTADEVTRRLSAVRFHRVLYPGPRPDPDGALGNARRVESSVQGTDFVEVFRAKALGGLYRVKLVLGTT